MFRNVTTRNMEPEDEDPEFLDVPPGTAINCLKIEARMPQTQEENLFLTVTRYGSQSFVDESGSESGQDHDQEPHMAALRSLIIAGSAFVIALIQLLVGTVGLMSVTGGSVMFGATVMTVLLAIPFFICTMGISTAFLIFWSPIWFFLGALLLVVSSSLLFTGSFNLTTLGCFFWLRDYVMGLHPPCSGLVDACRKPIRNLVGLVWDIFRSPTYLVQYLRRRFWGPSDDCSPDDDCGYDEHTWHRRHNEVHTVSTRRRVELNFSTNRRS